MIERDGVDDYESGCLGNYERAVANFKVRDWLSVEEITMVNTKTRNYNAFFSSGGGSHGVKKLRMACGLLAGRTFCHCICRNCLIAIFNEF